MALRWTDVHDIAIELEEAHPDVDIVNLRFTDLHRWVRELPDFSDDPNRSNEKILEAIQLAWIEERSGAQARSTWAGSTSAWAIRHRLDGSWSPCPAGSTAL